MNKKPIENRRRRKDSARIRALQSTYDSWRAAHPRAAVDFREAVNEILTDSGLAFDQVTARVKSWRSLRVKAMRKRADGSLAYPEPWNDIHDIIGVRVTTYHSTEIPHILEVLADDLEILRATDKTLETRVAGQLGYGSHHLVCKIGSNAPNIVEPYRNFVFEIQVRTVLQHAWAEFEHDIRYKSAADVVDPRIDRAFALAAGLIELADQQFDQIASILDENKPTADTARTDATLVDTARTDATRTDTDRAGASGTIATNTAPSNSDPSKTDSTSAGTARADTDTIEITAETLPGLLTLILPRVPRSKMEHYAWLEEILDANGVDTVGALRALVDPERVERVSATMRYRFTPGHARIIDDCLLAEFGASHIHRTKDLGVHPEARIKRMKARLALMERSGIVGDTGVASMGTPNTGPAEETSDPAAGPTDGVPSS